jgi:hypothetical protein
MWGLLESVLALTLAIIASVAIIDLMNAFAAYIKLAKDGPCEWRGFEPNAPECRSPRSYLATSVILIGICAVLVAFIIVERRRGRS